MVSPIGHLTLAAKLRVVYSRWGPRPKETPKIERSYWSRANLWPKEFKVDVPIKSDTAIGTPMFEWYWLGVDSRFVSKRHVLKEIGLYVQNMLIFLGFYNQHNWGGGLI